ncbi:MAG: UbiA family prenyltransferase [Candidatus Aenigmatarchaeota archaeon]
MNCYKLIRKFFEFFVFSSVHISIAAALWGAITFILLNESMNLSLVVIFFLTFFTYTLNRLGGEKEDIINYPERVSFSRKYRKFFIPISILFSLFSLLISLFLLDNIKIFFIVLLTPLLFLVYKFFKKTFLMKNILLGIFWSLPVFIAGISIGILNSVVFSFAIFVFLRDFINTIFFDLRDIKGDKKEGVNTIPVKIGVEKTMKLLNFMNIGSGLILLFLIYLKLLPLRAIFLLGLVGFNLIYYYLFKISGIDKFWLYDIIADSEIYFAFFLIILSGIWFQ